MDGQPSYLNGLWLMAGCYFHPCYDVWKCNILSLYLILHIYMYGIVAQTLILQDLQLMWCLLMLTQHDGGIRERGSVLYLGMVEEISS